MARKWSAMDPLAASLSDEDEDEEDEEEKEKGGESKDCSEIDDEPNLLPDGIKHEEKKAILDSKKVGVDFEALSRHGYMGGPSVLYVPPPRSTETGEQDWSWSKGNQKSDSANQEEQESIKEREQTHQAANDGAAHSAAEAVANYNNAKRQKREAAAERRALTYAQKEKRKRDFGQSSRGKNYVEEEKRLLRERGVYSGFDG